MVISDSQINIYRPIWSSQTDDVFCGQSLVTINDSFQVAANGSHEIKE